MVNAQARASAKATRQWRRRRERRGGSRQAQRRHQIPTAALLDPQYKTLGGARGGVEMGGEAASGARETCGEERKA